MTQSALARHRRSPAPEPTLRLIVFQLRHQGFCLPLAMARRVIFSAADNPTTALGLTQLNQETIPLIDIAHWVYHDTPLLPGTGPGLGEAAVAPNPDQTIVVVDSPRAGALGLLVDSLPTLRRAKASAFSPVPPTYLAINHIRGVNTLVNLSAEPAPLLLLNLEALLP
ncbi:chemotaxis protein CheW [Nodosilinea sp. P-1105]|uniref:chemotaxis protein CheW n=1 Tax=Nodosilinea sp. P-1105 TaxID=2546229 RepID=UPI00146D0D11|nr:chemotaxis protein CheW [Nodosilinea sp. P-1105]NMF84769.1 hypothetical protein [Nodosilinea sp. P-1105]